MAVCSLWAWRPVGPCCLVSRRHLGDVTHQTKKTNPDLQINGCWSFWFCLLVYPGISMLFMPGRAGGGGALWQTTNLQPTPGRDTSGLLRHSAQLITTQTINTAPLTSFTSFFRVTSGSLSQFQFAKGSPNLVRPDNDVARLTFPYAYALRFAGSETVIVVGSTYS